MAAMGFIFDAFEYTSFLSAMVVLVLLCTNVAIASINELDVKSYVENMSVAASMSNILAI